VTVADIVINDTLGDLLIKAEEVSKFKDKKLWSSSIGLSAVVYDIKRQQSSTIEYLRVSHTLTLRVLRHLKATLVNVIKECVDLYHSGS
jgi:hypothetical protein